MFDERGYFTGRSCVAVKKLIKNETGIDVDVQRTSGYLIFNYVLDGRLKTKRMVLPAGVFYCLKREHFDEFIPTLKDSNLYLG